MGEDRKRCLGPCSASDFPAQLGSVLQPGTGLWGGPGLARGHPRECPLTVPPWLAVPEVPTVEGAAPMAPLPVSLP